MKMIVKMKIGPEDFLSDIRELVKEGMSYTDAIVHYCDKNNIEVEVAAGFIKHNAKMKAQLQQEFEDLNLLPKIPRLPI